MKKMLCLCTVLLVVVVFPLVVICFADEPYDSIEALRPVPEPTAWPDGFLAASAEAGQRDLFNETNYWALWWAVNERVEALTEYTDYDQVIFDDGLNEWTNFPAGISATYLEWPVEPLVFYWSTPVPLGIVTQEVVTSLFEIFFFTTTVVYLDFTNINSVVTHIDDAQLLVPQTATTRLNSAQSPVTTIDFGDDNFGSIPIGYTEDVWQESDFPFSFTQNLNRVFFFDGTNEWVTNQVEDIFFGAIYGTGKALGSQLNAMDNAIRECTPFYVNHIEAPDPATFLGTADGITYRWGVSRDGIESNKYQPWHDNLPQELPKWNLASIGTQLVSQGVGAFIDFPQLVTNDPVIVEGWEAVPQDLFKQFVTNDPVVEVDLNRTHRFTLWPTSWWENVTMGNIYLVQTNLQTVEAFNFLHELETGGTDDFSGTYTRIGTFAGFPVLSTGSKVMWKAGRWFIGNSIGTAVFAGPDHEVFGTRWEMWLENQGNAGRLNRTRVNVGQGALNPFLNKSTSIHFDTVRHQDYKPLKVAIYPNSKTSTITCTLSITGLFMRIDGAGNWQTGTGFETIEVSGSSGVVAQTVGTYYKLTHMSIIAPDSFDFDLEGNKLPTNRVNGINIALEWQDPVTLYTPITYEGFVSAPYLQNEHQGYWLGMWERAQHINLLQWTCPDVATRPDRQLSVNEQQDDTTAWLNELIDDNLFTTRLVTAGPIPGNEPDCSFPNIVNSSVTNQIDKARYPSFSYVAINTCDRRNFTRPTQGELWYSRNVSSWSVEERLSDTILHYGRFSSQIASDVLAFHSYQTFGGWQYNQEVHVVDAWEITLSPAQPDDPPDIVQTNLYDLDTADFFVPEFNIYQLVQQGGSSFKPIGNRTQTVDLATGSAFNPAPAGDSYELYDIEDQDLDVGGSPETRIWNQIHRRATSIEFGTDRRFYVMQWDFNFHE